MIYWPTKAVADVRDYTLDWTPTLSKLGDPTIVSSIWTRLRGDADFTAGTIVLSSRGTLTRISNGTANTETVFRNTVTLSDAKVLTEDAFIKVRA